MSESGDLDQTALSVYRSILLELDADAAKIARRLDIPEQQTKAALEKLNELGLLTASWTDPDGLRAVSPDTGIQILAERERHRTAQRQQLLEQNSAVLAAFAAEAAARNQQSPLGTESILGADAIRVRLESFAESAETEVASFQLDDMTEKSLAAARVMNRRALSRGVRFRSIFLASTLNQRPVREHVRMMTTLGAEARVAPTLPMRLLLIDQQAAVLPAPPVDSVPRIIVAHFPSLVSVVQALFDAYWHQSRPAGETPATSPDGLSEQEREILRLLSEGATDDSVARALGIGVRTERRIVADLMDRLGASSRFEVGVKAARLGLV